MRIFRPTAVLVAILGAVTLVHAARADDLVVATFGGSFAEDTKTCNIQPFEKATGATVDRKSTRLNSSHLRRSRMPSSA